jgi:hypothetical protein
MHLRLKLGFCPKGDKKSEFFPNMENQKKVVLGLAVMPTIIPEKIGAPILVPSLDFGRVKQA